MQFEEDSFYVQKTKNGDLKAFGKLVQKHQGYAFTLAQRILNNHHESEEAVQDAFVKAFQAINSFEGKSKFTTWLYTIVYNEAVQKIRKRKNYTNIEDFREDSEFHSNQLDGFSLLNSNERKEILKDGLSKMKPAESAVLTLFYLNQFSIKEIEKITSQSKSQVKILLHRGRKNLYDILQKQTKNELSELL